MTRCVYLTFFGEYRGGHHGEAHAHDVGDELVEHDLADVQHADEVAHHGEPHESNGLITCRCGSSSFFSLFIGLLERARHREVHRVVRTALRVPRARRTPSSPSAGPSLSVLVALLGVGASYAYYWRNLGPQRLTRTQPGRVRGQAVPRQQVLPRRALHRRHRRFDQGPDRARGVLVQPARHRQRPQLHRSRRAMRSGRSPTTTSTRRASTASSTASASAPAKQAARCARSRPVACSSTHSCSSSRWACSPSRCGSRLSGGKQLDGMVGMGTEPRGLRARGRRSHRDAHPAREEELIKWVTLLTTLATLRRRRSGSSPTSTTTERARPAVPGRQQVDRGHQQPLPPRRRRHLAPAARAVGVHHGVVRHLLVEPLPRAAQPEGVPRARC